MNATPYTQVTEHQIARYHEIFDLVKDPENWKQPIDAVIPSWRATSQEVRDAVIWFTGSVPTITGSTMYARPHPDALVTMEIPALHVQAIGYYAAIGA